MKKLLISLALILTLTSCGLTRKVQYIEVPVVKTEYVAKTDTTIIRDSIFINRYQKSDTVFLTKEKFKYITKIKCDTLHRTDTVSVIKEVEVDRPYVPEYYHRVNTGFWVLLTLILGLVAFRIYKITKGKIG